MSTADSIHEALESFVAALNNLDWDAMRPLFAADATAFFPGAIESARVVGVENIERVFRLHFAEQRESGLENLDIVPRDIDVRELGEIAIAQGFEERSGEVAHGPSGVFPNHGHHSGNPGLFRLADPTGRTCS